jgi:hypothetical protein
VQIEASTFVAAPPATVYAVYADYRGWPQLFSTIKAVHVVSQDGPRVVLAIDHREGPVRNDRGPAARHVGAVGGEASLRRPVQQPFRARGGWLAVHGPRHDPAEGLG